MNTFTESIWADCRPHTWKYALRGSPMIGALVHATRSAQQGWTSRQDYIACKNWYKSPANKTIDSAGNVAGAFTHAIIGDGGKLCICLPDEFYPRWSAGHMDTGGLWSVEIAQSTIDAPFDPLDIERAEHEIALKSKQHGWPVRYIAYMHGDNREAPGVAFHDASRNGDILGKSDPGPKFGDRAAFVARTAARANGTTGGRMYTDKQIDEKVAEALALGVRNQTNLGNLANATEQAMTANKANPKHEHPWWTPRGIYYVAGKAWPF